MLRLVVFLFTLLGFIGTALGSSYVSYKENPVSIVADANTSPDDVDEEFQKSDSLKIDADKHFSSVVRIDFHLTGTRLIAADANSDYQTIVSQLERPPKTA
jgi:hypothetical protein